MDEPDEFGSTPGCAFRVRRHARFLPLAGGSGGASTFRRHSAWSHSARNAELVAYVGQRFAASADCAGDADASGALHGFMTAFRLPPGADALVASAALGAFRIEVPIVERPEGLLVRVSTHFYNTEEEIDRLAGVLPGLIPRCDESVRLLTAVPCVDNSWAECPYFFSKRIMLPVATDNARTPRRFPFMRRWSSICKRRRRTCGKRFVSMQRASTPKPCGWIC